MAERRVQRRLAAILAADVVGYARLMEADEEGTLARLKSARAEVIDPRMAADGGRIFKTTGDGILAEFSSAADAVTHAVEVQRAMAAFNAETGPDARIEFRIGISLGDVMVDGDDLFGNGVNIAARMEALAEAGGICVSGNVRELIGPSAELLLEDLGEQTVKNIDRPIRCYRVRAHAPDAERPTPPTTGGEARGIDRTAVAVLPFANMSGDPDQEHFADGLTEDIITALSLWRTFPVVARNSTFAYKGSSPDIRRIGEKLGARYVVEGSVRKAGDRVRITAQLIDAESGHHLWSEKYDRRLDDIFDLQDEITTRVSAIVGPQMARAERGRLQSRRPRNLSAWELYHRGMALVFSLTVADNRAARELFEQALALDPNYGQAYFGLAYTHHRDIYLDATEDRDESLRRTFELVGRAIVLDESNAEAHHLLAIANVWARDFDAAIAECELALRLNPSFAGGYFTKGAVLNYSGQPEAAIQFLEKGLTFNPVDPNRHIHLTFLASAHLNVGAFEKAEGFARQALQLHPDHFEAQFILVSSLGHLDRTEAARPTIDRWGNVRIAQLTDRALLRIFEKQENREKFVDGLRRAGVPE